MTADDAGNDVILSEVIPAKDSLAWTVEAGQVTRLTDLEGYQVGDLALFARDNLRDRLSISWTRTRNLRRTDTYAPPLGPTTGDKLWSTGFNVLATIVEDTPETKGVHDLFGRMCNRGMYEMYGVEPQDGCFELLQRVLLPYGIAPEDISDPLGVFMNTQAETGTRVMRIHEPVSRAGDCFSIRAEVDLIAAMSTCPMDVLAPTNGYAITPMSVEVISG